MGKMLRDDIKENINTFLQQSISFDNEKQFQFELAWFVKEHIPGVEIGFETRVEIDGNISYIDLAVCKGNEAVPIELKRKTRAQGAADEGSYDYFLDIHRLESIKGMKCHVNGNKKEFGKGFAIMITDFGSYYNGPRNNECYWSVFSLKHERKIEKGQYKWALSGNNGASVARKRKAEIYIDNEYVFAWKYKEDNKGYLVVEIK
ncbi:MAG: hypothetical protein J6N21_15830 [Butyrivibrio sp.]|nr:hypothetical protein [Butyrivibrio sp.]